MMFKVSGISLPLDAGLPDGDELIAQCVANGLHEPRAHLGQIQWLKRSVDARKGEARFIGTFAVQWLGPERPLQDFKPAKGVTVKEYIPYAPLQIAERNLGDGLRPVVVGSGPAGLFCALYLARAGLRPIVVERGGAIEERMEAVKAFDEGALLDRTTNIQFGEGGAGTFSDGKLTTGTKDPLAQHVLHWFVEAGAPEEISWQAKPHIGTDKLVEVVAELRRAIEEAGGTVIFHCTLADVAFDDEGSLTSIELKTEGDRARKAVGSLNGIEQRSEDVFELPCDTLVLACGHSARDTFRMLQRASVMMEPKPFSVGVRIEHPQALIDEAQYGRSAGHPALGPADYKLVAHLPNGRSVYTFCMCPGGNVVAAATEEFGVVVNGMSRFARDGKNANAALLVGVTPDDFPGSDPLAGVSFQRRIEQAAYGEAVELGGEPWQAPAQTVADFLSEDAGHASTTVQPTYPRGVVWCDLHEVLPAFVCQSLEEAFPILDRKLKGFADGDAVMTGVETRSSSPVRILRDEETLQAERRFGFKKVRARDIARGHGRAAQNGTVQKDIGIFPAGEGPGYAGGIMSAAVDGLRVARAVADRYEEV